LSRLWRRAEPHARISLFFTISERSLQSGSSAWLRFSVSVNLHKSGEFQ
jgi:hypothetical protein